MALQNEGDGNVVGDITWPAEVKFALGRIEEASLGHLWRYQLPAGTLLRPPGGACSLV